MKPETQTQKLFRLWHGPLSVTEIAKELGISISTLVARARRHKLGSRIKFEDDTEDAGPLPKDPTPEEIRAELAALQAEWSEEERLKRFQGKRRVAYIVPQYDYNSRNGLFTGLDN
jgi:hypothetical protein